MRKIFSSITAIFLVVSFLFSLVSCAMIKTNPEDRMTDKELFINSLEQIKYLFIDSITAGTEVNSDDLVSFFNKSAYDTESFINLKELSLGGETVVETDSPVRLSLNKEYDAETKVIHLNSKLEALGDSFSAEFLSKDGRLSVYIPDYSSETFVPEYLTDKFNINQIILDIESTKNIIKDTFTELISENNISRVEYGYQGKYSKVDNATRLCLNLSDVDISQYIYDNLKKINSLSSFEMFGIDIEEIEYDSVKPDDFKINMYLENGVLLGGDLVLSLYGNSLSADFEIYNKNGSQRFDAAIRYGDTGSEKELVTFGFENTSAADKKNGNFSIALNMINLGEFLSNSFADIETEAVTEETTSEVSETEPLDTEPPAITEASTDSTAVESTAILPETTVTDSDSVTVAPAVTTVGTNDTAADTSESSDESPISYDTLTLNGTFSTTVDGNRQVTDLVMNAGAAAGSVSAGVVLKFIITSDFADNAYTVFASLDLDIVNSIQLATDISFKISRHEGDISFSGQTDGEVVLNDANADEFFGKLNEYMEGKIPHIYEAIDKYSN